MQEVISRPFHVQWMKMYWQKSESKYSWVDFVNKGYFNYVQGCIFWPSCLFNFFWIQLVLKRNFFVLWGLQKVKLFTRLISPKTFKGTIQGKRSVSGITQYLWVPINLGSLTKHELLYLLFGRLTFHFFCNSWNAYCYLD